MIQELESALGLLGEYPEAVFVALLSAVAVFAWRTMRVERALQAHEALCSAREAAYREALATGLAASGRAASDGRAKVYARIEDAEASANLRFDAIQRDLGEVVGFVKASQNRRGGKGAFPHRIVP